MTVKQKVTQERRGQDETLKIMTRLDRVRLERIQQLLAATPHTAETHRHSTTIAATTQFFDINIISHLLFFVSETLRSREFSSSLAAIIYMFSYAALKYVFAKRVLILSLKCIRLLLIFILHVPPSQFFLYVQLPPHSQLHTAIAQRYNVASEWVENLELSDVEKTSNKSVFCCWLPTTKQQQRTQILPCCCDWVNAAAGRTRIVLTRRTLHVWLTLFLQVSSYIEWNSHSLSLTFLLLSHCARDDVKGGSKPCDFKLSSKKHIHESVSQKRVNCFSNLFILISDVVGRALKWNENDRARDVDGGREAKKKWKWSQIRTLLTHLRSTQQQRDAFCLWRHLFCFVKMSELHRSPLRVPRRMDDEKIITFFTQRWWWVRKE